MFTPDGRGLVIHSEDQVRLYDPTTGAPAGPAITASMAINATALAPNGQAVLTGSRDGVARLWDLASARPLTPPLHNSGVIRTVAISPSGDLFLVGCADGTARLWDRATAKPLGPPVVQGLPLLGVAFAPDGRSYLTTAEDGTTREWAVPDPVEGEPGDLRVRLEARTGLTLGGMQTVAPLSDSEWADRVARVGTEGPAPPNGLNTIEWHEARAHDAEQDGATFTAHWHLSRLDRDGGAKSWLAAARLGQLQTKANRLAAAATEYDRAAADAPPEEIEGWYRRRAAECQAGRQWAVALWYYDRLLSTGSGDWRTHVGRARVLDELGRPADRDAALERAVEAGAGPEVFTEAADRRAERSDWAGAVALYRRAADRGADGSEFWYDHALAALQCGNRTAHCSACDRLVKSLRPDLRQVEVNNIVWALCLGQDGSTDYDRLVARMTELPADDRTPQLVFLSTLGATLYRAGRFEEALERLRGCVQPGKRVHPCDAAFLAMAYSRAGDSDQARQWLAKVLLPPPRPWQARAEVEILIREANGLIDQRE